MSSPAFWKDKKLFLTGHTGFKGSWMALNLQMWGAKLCGFSLEPDSTPNLFTEANVAAGMIHQIGDIRNFPALEKSMREFQPEIVIHMAAQALVRHSYEDPVGTYATNVMGTVHLLEAIRNLDCVKSVVIVTTDKCYENRETMDPYEESSPLGGHDPYSSSKACAEIATASYRSSFFAQGKKSAQIASVRAGNVVGGGDWSRDRLIPDLIRSFTSGKSAVIRSPRSVRPWQHVMEPISGYLLLAEKLYSSTEQFDQAWNFGPQLQDARPVAEVTQIIVDQWGPEAKWNISEDPNHVHEAKLLTLDISKAEKQLGWTPRWSIEECLKQTTSWYRDYYQKIKLARDLTENQIRLFWGSRP